VTNAKVMIFSPSYQTKKQKTMQAPVYRGDSCWTAQRKRRREKEQAKEAEDMPVLTNYFNVIQTGVHATQTYCFCAEIAKVVDRELPRQIDISCQIQKSQVMEILTFQNLMKIMLLPF
jgi:hypothetical protein